MAISKKNKVEKTKPVKAEKEKSVKSKSDKATLTKKPKTAVAEKKPEKRAATPAVAPVKDTVPKDLEFVDDETSLPRGVVYYPERQAFKPVRLIERNSEGDRVYAQEPPVGVCWFVPHMISHGLYLLALMAEKAAEFPPKEKPKSLKYNPKCPAVLYHSYAKVLFSASQTLPPIIFERENHHLSRSPFDMAKLVKPVTKKSKAKT